MKLSLTYPATWESKQAPNNQALALLRAADGKPELILTYGALVLLPDEQRPWIEQTVRSELPPGATAKILTTTEGQTDTGWPLRVVEALILAPKSNEVLEVRLCAFYAFLEHAAVAIVRAPSQAGIETRRGLIGAILRSAAPLWKRPGQPACLADFWNLPQPAPQPKNPRVGQSQSGLAPRAAMPQLPVPESDPTPELLADLAMLDVALAEQSTFELQLARCELLYRLHRPEEAIAACQVAVALSPSRAEGHARLGRLLAQCGRSTEAAAAWAAAIAIAPQDVDSLYNLAQLQYNCGEFESALSNFRQAFDLETSEFLTLRKIVQTLHALGRFDEALAMREKLLALWRQSGDPRARLLHEYVLDQYQVGPYVVHAFETVHPRDPSFYPLYTFRLFDVHGHAVPFEVILETSDHARQAGVPYVLGIVRKGQFKVLATSAQLPRYDELKQTVAKLIREAAPPQHVH